MREQDGTSWYKLVQVKIGKLMDDKTIRREAQKRKWWYAASRNNGPAHIIKENRLALCGTNYNTRSRIEAKKLCGNCRKIAKVQLTVIPPRPKPIVEITLTRQLK